jgi:ATP-dependent Zn protease
VAELIQFAYNEAKSIITTQRRAVDALTESLIIARTVSGDLVRDLLQE